jgi:hypothetical protein
MRAERRFSPTAITVAGVLAALLLFASLFWVSYRHRTSWTAAKAVSVVQSSTSLSISQGGSSDSEELSRAQSAIMFSGAPITSLSAMRTPVDPDPVASFRQLIALPHDTPREAPHIDPRRMRTIVDRGVVRYASAKTDEERVIGTRLIQAAALAGFSPARDIIARNYPQSEAVRSVVPANDVIRYALGPVMDVAAMSEESTQIFLELGQHFARQGQLELFATQILNSLRGDSRPRLSYRIDTLLDLLVRVPGTCAAVARLVSAVGEAADKECSFRDSLRKYIETTAPAPEDPEEESRRRGLLMLNQLSGG